MAGSVPLTGVIHAAGVLDDGVIESLTADRVARVIRPKAAAAWHLHELTAGRGPDQFVLFSSISGVLGQAGRATTRRLTRSLTRWRSSGGRGLPGTSLAWGLWAVPTGMTAGLASVSGGRSGRALLGRCRRVLAWRCWTRPATTTRPSLSPPGSKPRCFARPR